MATLGQTDKSPDCVVVIYHMVCVRYSCSEHRYQTKQIMVALECIESLISRVTSTTTTSALQHAVVWNGLSCVWDGYNALVHRGHPDTPNHNVPIQSVIGIGSTGDVVCMCAHVSVCVYPSCEFLTREDVVSWANVYQHNMVQTWLGVNNVNRQQLNNNKNVHSTRVDHNVIVFCRISILVTLLAWQWCDCDYL